MLLSQYFGVNRQTYAAQLGTHPHENSGGNLQKKAQFFPSCWSASVQPCFSVLTKSFSPTDSPSHAQLYTHALDLNKALFTPSCFCRRRYACTLQRPRQTNSTITYRKDSAAEWERHSSLTELHLRSCTAVLTGMHCINITKVCWQRSGSRAVFEHQT